MIGGVERAKLVQNAQTAKTNAMFLLQTRNLIGCVKSIIRLHQKCFMASSKVLYCWQMIGSGWQIGW